MEKGANGTQNTQNSTQTHIVYNPVEDFGVIWKLRVVEFASNKDFWTDMRERIAEIHKSTQSMEQ